MNKEERYVRQRKKQLIELRELIYKRSEINKQVRKINREMYEWDTALIRDQK